MSRKPLIPNHNSISKALMLASAILATLVSTSLSHAQTTEGHELLKHDEGVWQADVKVWVPGTDQVIKGTGTETNKLWSGGLWLTTTFEGKFQGFPFRGEGHTGYDPKEKKLVGTWVDSMNPHLSVMKGTHDPETKTTTMLGTTIDPESGKELESKGVIEYRPDGSRLFSAYNKIDGEWVKAMEITYTKKEE